MDTSSIYVVAFDNGEEGLFYVHEHGYSLDILRNKKLSAKETLEMLKNARGVFHFDNAIEKMPLLKIRRNIVSAYEKDRKKQLNLDRVFIGNICQVDDIVDLGVINRDVPMFYWTYAYKIKYITLKENILLYKITNNDLREADFMELETSRVFSYKEEKNIGDYFIDTKKIRTYSSMMGTYQEKEEKGKVLKKYREYINGRY